MMRSNRYCQTLSLAATSLLAILLLLSAPGTARAQGASPAGEVVADEGVTTPSEEADMAKEQVFAVFDTSLGTFTTLLYTEKMPITTQNFIDLVEGNKEFMDPATGQMVKRRFYDGRKIFRVIQGFMFQTGAASDNNRYSSGYSIPDEFHPSLRYDKPGLLAMANAGPNTGSTQFFLTFSGPGCAHLQGKHPIFGEVVEGMEVVRKIEAVPVGGREGSAPLDPPVIDKVTIKRAAQP